MVFADALLRRDPLLIQPEALGTFVERALSLGLRQPETGAMPAAGWIEDIIGKQPTAEVVDGVAVIPLRGPLGYNLWAIEKRFGATDVGDVAALLRGYAKDPRVRAVFFDIDSPGGVATGIPELAATIAELGKPTAAFSSSMACSAAYWCAASCDHVMITPSALIGSVGTVYVLYDYSLLMANAGIRVEVIKSGEYKGAGAFGTSLTPEQRAEFQRLADAVGTDFRTQVAVKRRLVSATDLRGQVFLGADAFRRGFATHVVRSRDEALAQFLKLTGARAP